MQWCVDMNKEIAVSVIVPAFNAAASLERTVRSLMNQTLPELEIILVNDASTDITSEIIQALSKECGNLVHIDLPQNMGTHEARLAGIKAATAPWIGFLDADDIALPKMYEKMYKAGTENAVDIVACGSYRVSSGGRRLFSKVKFGRNALISEDIFEKFCSFQFGTGTLWNKLYRSEVVKPAQDLHYPWRQNINEDLLLSIGFFLRTSSLYLMKDMLHEYVLSNGSVTSMARNSDSFVHTYRAYAIAICLYEEFGEAVLKSITSMYRRQLDFSSYRVDSIEELIEFGDSLQEAIDVVTKIYPIAHALITSRTPKPLSLSSAARSLLSRTRVSLKI